MSFALILIACRSFLILPQMAHSYQVIQINGSLIVGKKVTFEGTVLNQFLGIPYAEPPLGPLRFQKPLPIRKYPSTAFANPPACPQYTDQPIPWYDNSTQKSEDCLYLNIWTPGDASQDNKKAVLYWIYGGGFRYGSIRQDLYSGLPLASIGDIVVVTVNYRMNVFGFFTTNTEDAPANIGIYDVLEGLKWVNQNIGAFGGDIQRITIGGESVGAITVGDFTLTPLADGLYTRLIMESSSPLSPVYGGKSNPVLGQKLAHAVGCASSNYTLVSNPKEVAECLKGVDRRTLAMAEFKINPDSTFSFRPQYGNDSILPKIPGPIVEKGDFQCKDLLFGTNKDEGAFSLTTSHPDFYGFLGKKQNFINKTVAQETLKQFLTTVLSVIPVDHQKVLAQYFPADLPEYAYSAIRRQLYTALGDTLIICPTMFYAEKCNTSKVFSYVFTHRPSVTQWAKWMGVTHFEEVQFVFGQPILNFHKYQPMETTLSRQMVTLWSNFVKTGVTSDSWPLFSKENPTYVNLGSQTNTRKTGEGPHLANCNFLRPAYLTNLKEGR